MYGVGLSSSDHFCATLKVNLVRNVSLFDVIDYFTYSRVFSHFLHLQQVTVLSTLFCHLYKVGASKKERVSMLLGALKLVTIACGKNELLKVQLKL